MLYLYHSEDLTTQGERSMRTIMDFFKALWALIWSGGREEEQNKEIGFWLNYDVPAQVRLGELGYSFIDAWRPFIDPNNFVIEQTGQAHIKLVLLHPKKRITVKEMLAEMEVEGLRPANLQEVLALDMQHPEHLGEDRPILALGSEVKFGESGTAPMIYRLQGERCVQLIPNSPRTTLLETMRFAAVRRSNVTVS